MCYVDSRSLRLFITVCITQGHIVGNIAVDRAKLDAC